MKTIRAEEFDRMFDDGEDISEYIDWDYAGEPGPSASAEDSSSEPENLVHYTPASRRISIDMPIGLVKGLDRVAERLGVNRQAVIKFAVDRFLDEERAKHGTDIA